MENTSDVFLFLWAGFLLLTQLWRWYFTWRLLGRDVLPCAVTMVFLACKSVKVCHVIAAVILFIAAAVIAALGYPRSYVVVVASGGCAYLSWIALPPAVLVLTTSNAETIHFLRQVYSAVLPLRVVALLDASKATSFQDRMVLLSDNMRTGNGYWRVAIKKLEAISPWVILDIRALSPAVREEMDFMTQPNMARKALFHAGSTRKEGLLALRGISATQVFFSDPEILQYVKDCVSTGFFDSARDSNVWAAFFSKPRRLHKYRDTPLL